MRKGITDAKIHVEQPLTANGRVQIDGALSVLLHNVGTQDATINGNLTVKAGAVLHIVSPAANVVINDVLTVHFASASGAKLEIVATRLAAEAYSNYSG